MPNPNIEKTFRSHAARYGADIQRWPEGQRMAARTWAQKNPQTARAILDPEQPLDSILDAFAQKQPSPELVARIVASADTARDAPLTQTIMESLRTLTGIKTTSPVMVAASLAFLLVFGFASGYSGYSYSQRQLTSEQVLAHIMGAQTQNLEDVLDTEGGSL